MQKRSILNRLTKQAKPHPKLGAFQVQLSMSTSHYLVYVNLCFMGLMFWHTTAAPWLRQFYAGASFWMFAIFMLLLISTVMLLDHKLVYPSRQAHISRQAYKHDNPAVRDLQQVLENQKKIMERLKVGNTEIVCLCGSTRFVELFNEYRQRLTYEGKIVLSIEIVTSQSIQADPQHCNPELKKMLDELHLRKIDLADKVFVINKGGYIGESTANEINYAKSINKPIEYLEAADV